MWSLSGATSGGLGSDVRCVTMLATSDRNQHSEISEGFVKLSICRKRVTPGFYFFGDATMWVARICGGFISSVVFKIDHLVMCTMV